MRIVYSNKEKRRLLTTSLKLLTTAALVIISGPSAYAQNTSSNSVVYNPSSAWRTTDRATAVNPLCLLERNYNPNIKVKVTSDITGHARISITNIPERNTQITSISLDGRELPNITKTSSSASAPLGIATTDLTPLYSGEYLNIAYGETDEVKLPIQSTTIAEAKMSLCADVIDELKNLNTQKAETINLDEMGELEIASASPTPLDIITEHTPPSESIVDISVASLADDMPDMAPITADDQVEPDAITALIEKVSSPEKDEPTIIDDISFDITNSNIEAETAEIEKIANIDAAIPLSADKNEIDLTTDITETIETAEVISENIAPEIENVIEAQQENVREEIDTDPMLDVESLIDGSLPPAMPMPPPLDEAEEVAETVEAVEETVVEQNTATQDLSAALEESLNNAPAAELEDFGAETSIENTSTSSEANIMGDDDILDALEQSLSGDTTDTAVSTNAPDTTAHDLPLDELTTIDTITQDQDTEPALQATMDSNDGEDEAVNAAVELLLENAETEDLSIDDIETIDVDSTELDQALIASLADEEVTADKGTTEQGAEPTENAEEDQSISENVPNDALFNDNLSTDIQDETSVSASEDQDIVDELSNEDFSDEELLALLDDPEALSDDFAEILVEDEFTQIKPMEGVRDMLGLGTPDEIKYRKVPWLIEEDIDSQWKEKVKLLEREKEMLRLRLADTAANPIADLISRKRNKRTQEELVDKIRALEAENKKLKKGLVLSDNPEEFIADKLRIKDPKSGMRMGKAPTSEIDLIDEEIDSELDSLETRMDSFLRGVGEDYAIANPDKVSPLSSSSLTQDIINILKAGYVVDPDSLKIRAYRHKSTGTAVTAWEAGDLQGRAERTVLPPNSDFTAYVDRFLNAAQLRCNGNFTAIPDTSTRSLRTLDIHCNDGAVGQRSSVLFIKHGSIITAIATTTNLPKGGADFLRDIRKRIIEGIRIMDRKKT